VDATKEAEEASIAAAAAAAVSAPEEAQVSLSGSTVTAACCSAEGRRKREGRMEIEERVSGMRVREKVEDRSR
jgi:hypothetical protein